MTLQMTEANSAPLRCPTATTLDHLPGTMTVDDPRTTSLPSNIGFSAKIISSDKDNPDAALKGIVVFDIGKKLQLSGTEGGESVDRIFTGPVSTTYQNRADTKSKLRLSVQLTRQHAAPREATTPREIIEKENASHANQERIKTSQKIVEAQAKDPVQRKESPSSKVSSSSSPESSEEMSVQTEPERKQSSCFINDRQLVCKLMKSGKEQWEQMDIDAAPVQKNITKSVHAYGRPSDTRQNNRYRTNCNDTINNMKVNNLISNSLTGWETPSSRLKIRSSETRISSRTGRRTSFIPSTMTFDGRPRSNIQERYSTLYGTPSPSDNYKFFHYADLRLYMKQYRRNHVCGAAERAENLNKYETGLYRLDEATESLFYKANCAIKDGYMLGLQSAPGTPMYSGIPKKGFCLPIACRQKLTRPKTMSSDENTLTHTMYVRQNGTFSRMWKTRDDGVQEPSIVIRQPPRTPQTLRNLSSADPQTYVENLTRAERFHLANRIKAETSASRIMKMIANSSSVDSLCSIRQESNPNRRTPSPTWVSDSPGDARGGEKTESEKHNPSLHGNEIVYEIRSPNASLVTWNVKDNWSICENNTEAAGHKHKTDDNLKSEESNVIADGRRMENLKALEEVIDAATAKPSNSSHWPSGRATKLNYMIEGPATIHTVSNLLNYYVKTNEGKRPERYRSSRKSPYSSCPSPQSNSSQERKSHAGLKDARLKAILTAEVHKKTSNIENQMTKDQFRRELSNLAYHGRNFRSNTASPSENPNCVGSLVLPTAKTGSTYRQVGGAVANRSPIRNTLTISSPIRRMRAAVEEHAPMLSVTRSHLLPTVPPSRKGANPQEFRQKTPNPADAKQFTRITDLLKFKGRRKNSFTVGIGNTTGNRHLATRSSSLPTNDIII